MFREDLCIFEEQLQKSLIILHSEGQIILFVCGKKVEERLGLRMCLERLVVVGGG
jgi:hypothetical protein